MFIIVGMFEIPTKFTIIDYEKDDKVTIILWRLFLATAGALIDAREGNLKIWVNDEEIIFRVYKILNMPSHNGDLCMIMKVKEDESGVEECELMNVHYSNSFI